MLRTIGLALLIALVIAALGCAGGSGSGSLSHPGGPALGNATSVVVTPANTKVFESEMAQFQATVVGETDQAVIWSVVESSGGTINGAGLYTAPKQVSGRQPFHIVATSRAVPTASGVALVTVPVPQVTISPEAGTLDPGGTQAFAAMVQGLTDTSVTWTVEEMGGGSVTQSGIFTAPLPTGFYHVIATSVADPSRTGLATVTVTTSPSRFIPTGAPLHDREEHTSTLLFNGQVLVAGGSIRVPSIKIPCYDGIVFAELYDPAAGSFVGTGNMTSPRFAHAATLLPDGEVLLTGGIGVNPDCEDSGPAVQSTAELYNTASHSFRATGNMKDARSEHTATLLPNGKVLIVAGITDLGVISNTAELYDPATGVFTSTASTVTPRFQHTATLLPDGKVLVVGGFDSTSPTGRATATAELYDPGTGSFKASGGMATARAGHAATLLPNGTVLVTGGFTNATDQTAGSSAELYNPFTGSFSPAGQMLSTRAKHTATLLPSGMVLLAGGATPTAELYNPPAGSFSTTGSMETQRSSHSATLLPNGKVLVIGGTTAELYK